MAAGQVLRHLPDLHCHLISRARGLVYRASHDILRRLSRRVLPFGVVRGRLVRGVLEPEIPGHLLDGSLDGRVGVYELLYSGLCFLLPELFRQFLQLGAVVQKPVLELPERSAETFPGAIYGLVLDPPG